jgi:hypothetical protein
MTAHSMRPHQRLSRILRTGLVLLALLVFAAMVSPHAHASDWVEQKVFDSQGAGYDHFGSVLAISGTTALIAAPEVTIGENTSQGVVYVYRQSTDGHWNPVQTLVASDGAAFNEFGWAVALSGRTAVISAINATIGANSSQGAVYVFDEGDDGTWLETQKLVAADGQPVDWFGNAVALSDTTLVVGAYGAHYNDQAMRGALYVFGKVDGSWAQTQELAASDGAGGDELGLSVALSGSTMFASAAGVTLGDNYAQGAVYVFDNVGGLWSETQKLLAIDGAASDQLGTSIAIDGDTALIGAIWHHSGHGVAYLFNRVSGSWSQASQLSAADGATPGTLGFGLPSTDNFGLSVALHGDTALIGGDNIGVGGNDGQGLAYQFTNVGGTWSASHTFVASDGAALDYLGCAVAFDGDHVLAGAFGFSPDDNHFQQGAAYFYTATPDDGVFNDGFDGL